MDISDFPQPSDSSACARPNSGRATPAEAVEQQAARRTRRAFIVGGVATLAGHYGLELAD